MSAGYIYILSNPSMPGIVKIGRSIHGGKKRAREIYQTGVPTPFHLEWEMYVDDCIEMEALAHEVLDSHRVSGNREFFRVENYEAIQKILNEYVGNFDCCVREWDWIVDEDVISLYQTELNLLGFEIRGPEIPYALSDLGIQTVGNAVTERREKAAKRRERKNKEAELESVN